MFHDAAVARYGQTVRRINLRVLLLAALFVVGASSANCEPLEDKPAGSRVGEQLDLSQLVSTRELALGSAV